MKINPILVLLVAPFLFFSCGNNGEDETDGVTEIKNDTATVEQKKNTQAIFSNIPSPLETTMLLSEIGAEYDVEYTNDPLQYKIYTSEEKRAINLGVFGADLSFAGVLNNNQECMAFLKAVNGLCKDLGIAGVFDEKTADRLERNRESKDSILSIVSTSFWDADAYLKENQRPNTSSLLVAGGWVEGMFIAVKVYEKTKNKKLKDRIVSAPQKSSLNSLVILLESEKQTEGSQFFLDGLRELKKSFDKIPEGTPITTAVTDNKTGVTSIETKNDVKVDDAVFNEILTQISSLRAKIISAK
jgi:hypothetical protein